MKSAKSALLLGLVVVLLPGCGFIQFPPAQLAKPRQPLAPIIGEPVFVRVYKGAVNLAQGGDNPFSPPGDEARVKGARFIAVGFSIGSEQTLAIDDYELIDDPANPDDAQIPFAVRGEGPGATEYFYGTANFGDSVALTRGTQETTSEQGQGPDEDPQMVAWQTPAPVVLMLFEIADNVKSVTLRHGSRSFKLEPDAGLINDQPGSGK